MKTNHDIPDEHLARILGEAMIPKPDKEETFAAWQAFEKRHAGEMHGRTAEAKGDTQDDSVYIIRRRNRIRIAGLSVLTMAAAAILQFFFFPAKEVETVSNPLELYSETASPVQVEQTKEGEVFRVATPAATTTLVTLPDGTKVTLNASSCIEYPATFDGCQTREIKLKGEAHFEVSRNPHQPFVVTAGDIRTQVLGTVFDVKAYNASSSKVVLMEGHVKVSNTETSVDMTPGQTATLEADRIILAKSLPGEAQDWRKGDFDMDHVTLAEAMADIGAWYNKTVVFKSDDKMKKYIHFRFSRKASLDEVLTALNEMGVAKIEYKKGKVTVR